VDLLLQRICEILAASAGKFNFDDIFHSPDYWRAMCVVCWPVTVLDKFINRMTERQDERLKILQRPTQQQLKILAFNYSSLSAVAYYAVGNEHGEACLPLEILGAVLGYLNNKAGIKYSGFSIYGIITVADKTRGVGGTAKPRDRLNNVELWCSWENVSQAYDLHGTIADIAAFQHQQFLTFQLLVSDADQDPQGGVPNDDQPAGNQANEDSSDPESESSEGMVEI
jgi:hypothetical protein